MTDPVYCYPPEFTVLRNELNIKVAHELAAAERQFVDQRLLEAVRTGDSTLSVYGPFTAIVLGESMNGRAKSAWSRSARVLPSFNPHGLSKQDCRTFIAALEWRHIFRA